MTDLILRKVDTTDERRNIRLRIETLENELDVYYDMWEDETDDEWLNEKAESIEAEIRELKERLRSL